MSRKFNDKNLDMVNLEVVSADKVWKKKDNKYILDKKNYNIYGKVDKGLSAFVTSCNLDGSNSKFRKDIHNLPIKIKNQITNMILNKNKKVVYLVKKKK